MNETYEREINLKWLLYRVLRGWRSIVVWAIVIGLVLGLGSFGLNMLKLTDEEFIEGAKLNYEREHASWVATKENLLTQLDNLSKAKERQVEYNEKSIMMDIDPLRKNVASFELYVVYDYKIQPDKLYQDIDYSDRILRSYATYMTNGELYHHIINNLSYDIELRYLTEIFSVSVDYNNNLISASVVHENAAACQEILSIAKKAIEDRKDIICSNIAEHELTETNQAAYETIDLALEDRQEANLQYISDVDISIQKVNEELNEWEKEPEPTYEFTPWEITKGGIKMLIIGGVVGAVVVAVIIAFVCLMSGKLLNPEDMKNRFGIRVIGQLPQDRVKKPFAFISRWFAAFGGITTKPEEYAALAKMIGSSVKSDIVARTEKNWKKIVFTGTVDAEEMKKAVDAMGIGSEYTVVCASDVLTNAASIEKVSTADCVILVEKQEKALLADIEKELEALKAWNKPVLGAVVLNTDAVL